MSTYKGIGRSEFHTFSFYQRCIRDVWGSVSHGIYPTNTHDRERNVLDLERKGKGLD
jgi:hypothetical protein